MYFGARRNMSLYKPLIIFVKVITVSSSLIPIRDTFNSRFKDFIK